MSTKFDWKELENAKADLIKRAESLKKAFMEMPGGAPAGGMPPEAAGVPPEMAGAMPPGGDPAAAGIPPEMAGMPPEALAALAGGAPMGVDPATAGMMGGMPPAAPADPAAAGAAGAVAGAAGAGTPEPTLTLSLSQLWDVVKKVLALAKTVGANGQGVPAEGTAAPAQPQGVNQDAIKAAVIEALGSMGAMR